MAWSFNSPAFNAVVYIDAVSAIDRMLHESADPVIAFVRAGVNGMLEQRKVALPSRAGDLTGKSTEWPLLELVRVVLVGSSFPADEQKPAFKLGRKVRGLQGS
jgi:hypothetical protein